MTGRKFTHSIQDEYYTPEYAVNIVLPHIKGVKTIWCPFDEESSNYVKVLRKHGYTVHATHIDNGQDFLTFDPQFQYDAIISNPPFSIKSEVLNKCIQLDKPFALLLPFTMFNSISTIKAISKTDINYIMMDKRISFNGERPNFTCWYVCSKMIDSNKVFLFDEDPRKLYKAEQS